MFPTPIVTVQATDADDPSNHGAIRYILIGPQSELFTIDELAGVVQVAPGAVIDREKDETHTISVLAVDTPAGGPLQRTATATLHILVEDENDNDPECKADEFLIPENAAVGTPIGNITCQDPDKDPQITYRFSEETQLDLFSIDKDSGRITVAKNLRGRGRTAPYVMTVVIEDGKERQTSLTVGIKVANVIPNDGKPQFTHAYFNATILEGASRGTTVFQVRAVDTDSFDNGEGRLQYHLNKQMYPCHSKINREKITEVEDVDFFRLDEINGVLTLKDVIDREKMDCFSVLVTVEDAGTPPQSEAEWFEIHVQDIDDSTPYLAKEVRNLKLHLNETTKKGTVVYNFTGIDPDLYPNNLISFEISGGGSDLFQVVPLGHQNASLVLSTDLVKMEHDDLTLVIKCHPKDKRVNVPDCISKVNIRIVRDTKGNGNYRLNSKTKFYEMIVGAAAGSPVGNLIGNAGMPKKIQSSGQMYHPMTGSSSPHNVTEAIHIDENTGDIFVWDNLEKYTNGHLRVQMIDESGGMKKNLKVFIMPNDQLLSASMIEFSKLQKWIEETEGFLNTQGEKSGVKRGQFRVLTFDHSHAPDGETRSESSL
jgi:cadherin 23